MMYKVVLLTNILALASTLLLAQNNPIKRLENRIKWRTEQKVNQKVDRAVDDVLDGKANQRNGGNNSGSTTNKPGNNTPPTSGSEVGKNSGGVNSGKGENARQWSTFSQFDFVPGDRTLAYEDFSQDKLGDIPSRWNTDASAEVVTIEGQKGHWMQLKADGAYLPEFITRLPENFTLEFDMICSPNFSFYAAHLTVAICQLVNPSRGFTQWRRFAKGSDDLRNGAWFRFHPRAAGNKRGQAGYEFFEKNKSIRKNDLEQDGFVVNSRPESHVAIWRQGQRVRVYINEFKVFDLPRLLEPGQVLNSLVFGFGGGNNNNDGYYITNIRLAESSPSQTRNKLVEEGRLSTNGILFDFQSAVIKPESHNVIKEIADVLNENRDMKLLIVGHTSNDGDAGANLELSQRRAMAVKNYLVRQFNISESRLETDGKGGTELIDRGNTPEAKSRNRRVEFIKK